MLGRGRWVLCTLLAANFLAAAHPQDNAAAGDASVTTQEQNITQGSGEEGAQRTSGAASAPAKALDAKAMAIAEARAKFQAMEAERVAREAEERRIYTENTRQKTVVYGGIVTFRHEETQGLLSATNFRYYHPHGSGQHQVTCEKTEDGYSHWRVMPRVGQRWEEVKDVPVKGGDTIRLLNLRTQRCLHSHAGPVSPVSGENEVSNFNREQGSLDSNDHWVIKLTDDGSDWKMATEVRLIHPASQSLLVSRSMADHNPRYNYTMGHQEVSGRKLNKSQNLTDDRNDVWTVWPIEGAPGFDRYLSVYESAEERDEKFAQSNSDPDNGPKEISIYCPQNPVVSVQDLDYNLVSEGKCFSLNLQSPTFESSLTLSCDGKGKR